MSIEKIIANISEKELKERINKIANKYKRCEKKGHPNRNYLYTTNNGKEDLCYDNYQCIDCGKIIKEYNHKATLRFIESLNAPCTI